MKLQNLFLPVLLLAFSCTQQNETEIPMTTDVVDMQGEDLLIDRISSSVSSNDAKKVAMMFLKGNSQTRAAMSVDEVLTLNDDETQTPLLHIINFANDNGYVLVSANKNTMPILAYSDKGHFELTDENASSLYVDEYKALIKDHQACTTDSLRRKYALQWAAFEKTENNVTRVLSTSESALVENEVRYRESMGYEHLGNLSVAKYFLPERDYQALVAEMKDCCDPQYDYMDFVQVFVKSYDYEIIGELLKTKWHQLDPFNVDAPNGLAGCVPIAIAQIAYYHKYPTKYNWNNIYVNPVGNGDFNYFIKDIRDKCGVKYNGDGTASSTEKAKNAILSLGYGCSVSSDVYPILNSQLHKKNPVCMDGYDATKKKGHAWVCDGYKNVKYEALTVFIPSPSDPRFKRMEKSKYGFVAYETKLYPNSTLEGHAYGEFFHMNMGWSGRDNGWYRINTAVTSSSIPTYKYKNVVLTMEK